MSIFPGMPPDLSLFDQREAVPTLERVIDFEYLNDSAIHTMVCCVDMETGDPVYFDNREGRLAPVHFLASTGFIPAFPPVELAGACSAIPAS